MLWLERRDEPLQVQAWKNLLGAFSKMRHSRMNAILRTGSAMSLPTWHRLPRTSLRSGLDRVDPRPGYLYLRQTRRKVQGMISYGAVSHAIRIFYAQGMRTAGELLRIGRSRFCNR